MREKLSMAAKLATGILVFGAWILMIRSVAGTLSDTGVRSLRYFTVLSNFLCGIAALIHFCFLAVRKSAPRWVLRLSYMGAAAVGVTLMVIMLFLGPLYGYREMLKGANLWFHLLIPLLAILDHILLEPGERPSFRDTFLCLIPVVLYGAGYVANLLINGVGEWPDTNDWYLFTIWGTPVAACIAMGILLLAWGIALALRALGRVRTRYR
ncbi:MAG: Pr6Pr family membrane protein [Oscillospiraceae bacterium]|nr:Pr6Pr family membrane protein [Oscillospiraceae bacterium]